jgi:hypothetical protein
MRIAGRELGVGGHSNTSGDKVVVLDTCPMLGTRISMLDHVRLSTAVLRLSELYDVAGRIYYVSLTPTRAETDVDSHAKGYYVCRYTSSGRVKSLNPTRTRQIRKRGLRDCNASSFKLQVGHVRNFLYMFPLFLPHAIYMYHTIDGRRFDTCPFSISTSINPLVPAFAAAVF